MPYTKEEEYWNTLTHGIGAILSLIGLMAMLIYTAQFSSTLAVICSSIYGGSLVLLYTASTVYHASREKRWKDFFRKVDKLCIYLLIAGTYTPVLMLGIGGTWGWVLLSIIWALVVLGFVFQFSSMQKSESWSLLIYIAMGWLAVVAVKPMLENLSLATIICLVTGGVLYTSGVYFYAQERIRFNHVIWHLFVLGGSISHFVAIFLLLLA